MANYIFNQSGVEDRPEIIQGELETVPFRPILSFSGRNMHQIWTDGKSIEVRNMPLGIITPLALTEPIQ
jgi:hypothetical protein